MSNKTRILEIKEGPFSWKERDILTAVEKYMNEAIDFPMVEYAVPCFYDLDDASIKKIAQIWRYMSASLHLQQITKSDIENDVAIIKQKAARIYEQEAQRILGSLFPLEHKFWAVFYCRQETNEDKLLVAIDALFYSAGAKTQITYQLLLQSLKAIAKGYYATHRIKKKYFENAKRLIIDLPLTPFRSWINAQLSN